MWADVDACCMILDGSAIVDDEFERRLAEGYGVFEAPFAEMVRAIADGRLDPLKGKLVAVDDNAGGQDAIGFLRRLTHPPTRHVLVPLDSGTTGTVNNGRNGSDVADCFERIASVLGVRAARVVDCVSRTWTRSKHREVLSYEARILELVDGRGASLKSIHCMNDGGRWSWSNAGAVFSVEAGFDYGSRRIKKRFTRQNLRDLVSAVGLAPLPTHPLSTAKSVCMVEERVDNREWRERIEGRACTPEERNDPALGYFERGMGWVEHMDTHFESVIADFERAVSINAEYESRARPYLERAYQLARRTR